MTSELKATTTTVTEEFNEDGNLTRRVTTTIEEYENRFNYEIPSCEYKPWPTYNIPDPSSVCCSNIDDINRAIKDTCKQGDPDKSMWKQFDESCRRTNGYPPLGFEYRNWSLCDGEWRYVGPTPDEVESKLWEQSK